MKLPGCVGLESADFKFQGLCNQISNKLIFVNSQGVFQSFVCVCVCEIWISVLTTTN